MDISSIHIAKESADETMTLDFVEQGQLTTEYLLPTMHHPILDKPPMCFVSATHWRYKTLHYASIHHSFSSFSIAVRRFILCL